MKIQNKLQIFPYNRGVRQGCRLSPILFKLYINDLAFDLNNSNLSSIKLPNGAYVSCLVYADDVILIASTSAGL